jgi:hypothetical protein
MKAKEMDYWNSGLEKRIDSTVDGILFGCLAIDYRIKDAFPKNLRLKKDAFPSFGA